MATVKPTFAKMCLKISNDVKTIQIGEQDIEVKQYLPINEKLNLVQRVLENSMDENNFQNPIKLEVFTSLEIVFAYTNISFTEKQKEDTTKLYDLLDSNGIFNSVIEAIPGVEYQTIIDGVQETSNAIYTYKNSLMGIIETVSQDYSNLNLDASGIQKALSDPTNLELLKGIMTKLG